MSWVGYLLGCALVSAIAVAIATAAARLLARPGLEPDRFPSTASRLDALDTLTDRGGYTWARIGGIPLRVRVRPTRAPTQISLDLLGQGASVTIRARTHKRWRPHLAAFDGDELDHRFAACFEFDQGLGWPGPAAKAALVRLLEDEPGLESLEIAASPRGVSLRARATPVADSTLAAALTALLELAAIPERLHDFDPPRRPAGAGATAGVGLFWALLLQVSASSTAGFAEHTEATVVGRDESWLGNGTSLIVRDADGSERGLVWVPIDLYRTCAAGQTLRRAPFSLQVACDERSHWHLAFLAQLPVVLLCWMAMVGGVLRWLEWRDESRERSAGRGS